MPVDVLMPALSPTMEKGNLAKWVKSEGDKVKAGDVIAEIETDKATMEVEAVDEGTLGKILVPEGTADVAVNTPIAVILNDGESAADIKSAAVPAAPAKAAESAPPAEAKTEQEAPATAAKSVAAPVPESNDLLHALAPACEPSEPALGLFHGGGLVPSNTWWYRRRHHGACSHSGRGHLRSAGRKVGRRPRSVAGSPVLGSRAPAGRTRTASSARRPDRATRG